MPTEIQKGIYEVCIYYKGVSLDAVKNISAGVLYVAGKVATAFQTVVVSSWNAMQKKPSEISEDWVELKERTK